MSILKEIEIDGVVYTLGADGSNGVGISSIEKTSTSGLVDTYTITFTDGNTKTFAITNGADGKDGDEILSIEKTSTSGLVDTYTVTFTAGRCETFTITNGADGKDGKDGINGVDGVNGKDGTDGSNGVGISSIEKTSTSGLVDTYTITFTDGNTKTFAITNGADGKDGTDGTNGADGDTPYIGANGNWWVGDTDTGVIGVVQEPGDSPTAVMSQKATTELAEKITEHTDVTYSYDNTELCPHQGYVTTEGAFVGTGNWRTTEYIPVNESVIQSEQVYGNATATPVTFYDADKNFISSIIFETHGFNKLNTITPVNAKYARLSLISSSLPTHVKTWCKAIPEDKIAQGTGDGIDKVISQKGLTNIVEGLLNGECYFLKREIVTHETQSGGSYRFDMTRLAYKSPMVFDYDVEIRCETGYRFEVDTWSDTSINPDSLIAEVGWLTKPYIVKAGTIFTLLISEAENSAITIDEYANVKIYRISNKEEEESLDEKITTTAFAKRVGGVNLFNGVSEVGSLSEVDGSVESSNISFISSGFIPVKKGFYYYDTNGGYINNFDSGANVLCFYDKDKNFISRQNYARLKSEDIDNAAVISEWFLAPEDGFIRFQFNKHCFAINKFCVIESSEAIAKMSDMPEYSYSAEVRFKNIEEKLAYSEDSLGVLERNQSALDYLRAAAKYGYNGQTVQEKRFATLITTDVHADSVRLRNAIEVLNKVGAIDCGLCIGDMQGGNFSESDGTWYTNIINTAQKPFYTVLGNHDQMNYPCDMTGGTPTEAFNKFIQPTLGVMEQNITKPYYKVLYDSYKIALICLNNFDAPTDKNADDTFIVRRDTECISAEQLDWFIEALSEIPTDYHLMIARHSFPSGNRPTDNKWSERKIFDPGNLAYADNDIIPDIVDAWINGASLSKTYTPESGFEICPTHNVSVDFSSRGKGNFVCYLIGHTHADLVSISTSYENQVIVGFSATACEYQNYSSDLPRLDGTRSQDAITAVTVDTASRKIRLVRFGSDITFDLVKRDVTAIDY